MIRYTYIGKSFSGPGVLDAEKTVWDLVNIIARQTTLSGEQIETLGNATTERRAELNGYLSKEVLESALGMMREVVGE